MASFLQLPKNLTRDKILRSTIVAIGLWYVIVCLAGYFYQRPMWNDEDCVFQSIKFFNTKEMFSQPLRNVQVFPRVYLFSIQQFSKPFDFHLLALRFFSFAAMMGAFFIWLKIARYEFKNKIEYLTFVLSWPASAVLLYYASELKQYSMDILVAAVFLLFLYHQEKLEKVRPNLRYELILMLLPALILFSYITLFFCILPLWNLFLSFRENKKAVKFIIVYLLSLGVFMSLSYIFDVRLRPVQTLMVGFGDYFISVASVPEFFKTLGEGTMNLLSRWFVERPKILKQIGVFFVMPGFLYMFYAFFKNIKKCRYRLQSLETIAFVLYCELFFLGLLKKYPFTVPRTSLFFCPIVFYLVVKWLSQAARIHPYLSKVLYSLYAGFLIFLAVSLAHITFAGQLTFRPVLW